MNNLIEYDGKRYIQSKNIRVFPCAYRGYYNTNVGGDITAYVFDPEAKANTESNIANTYHKLSNTKESYVIAWIPDTTAVPNSTGTLRCVIGGYYFEIYGYSIDDFFYIDSGVQKPYYLCIKTDTVALGTSGADESDNRATKILSSFAFEDAINYLDIYTNNTYLFTGLCCSTTEEGTASLVPFIASAAYSYNSDSLFAGGLLTESAGQNKYYLNEDGNYVLAAGVTFEGATQLYTRGELLNYTYQVDPAKLPVTNLLDVGQGQYSIQMVTDITDQGTNSTTATGDYAIALGRSTIASGTASIALGNDTIASGRGAFAAGNETTAAKLGSVALGSNTNALGTNAVALGNTTTASSPNAVALGTHTVANNNNQVVLGAYNVEDATKAFIIANGTIETPINKFTVSYNGDIKALGNLEVNGNTGSSPAISSTGSGANDFVLGKITENSYGSIKVYGNSAGENPVFKVTNTGATTIAGATEISGTTSITNSTGSTSTTSGALKVSGGVGIGQNIYVGGSANITGATVLNNTLQVADNKSTTLGGTLSVKQAATLQASLEVTGITTLKNVTNITNDTESTSTGTGALKISGGAGIAKNLNVGGTVNITGKTQINSTIVASGNDAALTVKGGEIVEKNLIIKGTDESTSATSGALVIAGGVGIGGKLYVNNNTSISGDATVSKNLQLTGGSGTHNLTVGHKNQAVNSDKSAGTITTYTTAGNYGFTVDETGASFIGNKLTISSDTPISSNTRLLVGGNTTIEGTITAKSLNLSDTASISDGYIKADKVEAADDLIAKALVLKNTAGDEIVRLDVSKGQIQAPQINLKVTGENKAVTAEGRFTSTGYTTLANKVTVDASGNLAQIADLTATGKIQARQFNATSDARKKTNIVDYYCNNSILNLPIKSFEYLNDPSHTTYIGCLAQDLQSICPELVNTDADGFLSIQETKLIYLLLDEVKKLKTRIEVLEEI
jgi:hypothetical protein